MTRRRGRPRSAWGRAARCPACGGDLIWPSHTPKRIDPRKPRKLIPLDAAPADDDPGARYAVHGAARTRSRWLEDDEEPDVVEHRHHSHIYTCPAGVTPDQLADPTPQNGPRP